MWTAVNGGPWIRKGTDQDGGHLKMEMLAGRISAAERVESGRPYSIANRHTVQTDSGMVGVERRGVSYSSVFEPL